MGLDEPLPDFTIAVAKIELTRLTRRPVKLLRIFGSGTIALNFAVINIFSRFDYGCLRRNVKFVDNI